MMGATVTPNEFIRWLTHGTPRIGYFRGNLGVLRRCGDPHPRNAAHLDVPDLARMEAEAGTLLLTQKRLGPDDYLYIATKRRRK